MIVQPVHLTSSLLQRTFVLFVRQQSQPIALVSAPTTSFRPVQPALLANEPIQSPFAVPAVTTPFSTTRPASTASTPIKQSVLSVLDFSSMEPFASLAMLPTTKCNAIFAPIMPGSMDLASAVGSLSTILPVLSVLATRCLTALARLASW